MEGCAVVFHTASPFTSNFDDPQRDLVDPAVNGTRNVLETANRTPSVQRVVVTSSCAAIYGDNKDVQNAPGKVLTEETWNTTSSLDRQPYSYSKVEAEKAAWAIADAQSRWRLVTINPSLVIGKTLSGNSTSESHTILKQFGDGTLKAGAPPMEIGMVDVRDVAEAHLRAGFLADAKGRHIASGQTVSRFELGQMPRQHFGDDWPFPTRELPKWLLWLIRPDGQQAAVASDDIRQYGIPLAGGQFQVEARTRHRVPSGQRRGGGNVSAADRYGRVEEGLDCSNRTIPRRYRALITLAPYRPRPAVC